MEKLKVRAAEILPGDIVVGWDRSGKREEVVATIPPLATGQVGLQILHPWGSTALYIPQDAHVFIERKPMSETAPTEPAGAYLAEHAYDSFPKPVPFWIVRCDHPDHGPIALNSGHHYRERDRHHAEALAAKHNAEEHAPKHDCAEGEHWPCTAVTAVRERRAYDAEMAERAAIQADAENERDGWRD